MKIYATVLVSIIILVVTAMTPSARFDPPTYVGSATCIGCHQNTNADLVTNYVNSGHPYKLNPVNGGPPVYPEGTSPVEIPLPGTATWDDFAYVIGGYGWKARYVRKDGTIYTDDDQAQYNLQDGSTVTYHLGETRYYDEACFQCHTTGNDPAGSWSDLTPDLGTFSEPGIRCEGCHGPGSDHVVAPTTVKPPIQGDDLRVNRCAECHNRGGQSNAIPASGLYVRHHEQFNELSASPMGDGQGAPDLACASCHDPHVPLRYEDVALAGTEAIKVSCETCHPGQEIMLNDAPKEIECVDCHMPHASKSAVGVTLGNGFKGDLPTHIFNINTNPVGREAMFTEDGGLVKLDDNGNAAVTLDFVCLQCHTDKNVQWASDHAQGIHTNGIHTAAEDLAEVPDQFELGQNYPNPFNPSTTIAFALPEASDVTIDLYSVDGRLIQTMLSQTMPAGNHEMQIDLSALASGSYMYQLTAGSYTESKMMTLMK